jgi:hypothetical protein
MALYLFASPFFVILFGDNRRAGSNACAIGFVGLPAAVINYSTEVN